jgi:hypothetical protein
MDLSFVPPHDVALVALVAFRVVPLFVLVWLLVVLMVLVLLMMLLMLLMLLLVLWLLIVLLLLLLTLLLMLLLLLLLLKEVANLKGEGSELVIALDFEAIPMLCGATFVLLFTCFACISSTALMLCSSEASPRLVAWLLILLMQLFEGLTLCMVGRATNGLMMLLLLLLVLVLCVLLVFVVVG